MCRGSGVLAAFGLSFAQLELLLRMQGTGASVGKSLGQLVWRRVHWRGGHGKAQVQDGEGLQSWFGDGEEVQQAGLEDSFKLSEHGQDQAFRFLTCSFCPWKHCKRHSPTGTNMQVSSTRHRFHFTSL